MNGSGRTPAAEYLFSVKLDVNNFPKQLPKLPIIWWQNCYIYQGVDGNTYKWD